MFRVDVDDMQFLEFLVGPFGLLRVVSDVDEVELSGVDLGFNWRATDSFRVFAGFGATDSEIDSNSSRPATVGNSSPYTPDYTGNLALDFNHPLSDSFDSPPAASPASAPRRAPGAGRLPPTRGAPRREARGGWAARARSPLGSGPGSRRGTGRDRSL